MTDDHARLDPAAPAAAGLDHAQPGGALAAGAEGTADGAQARAARPGWLDRRRDKIRAELERNRQGDHKVPTWALAVLLIVIVVGWVALIIAA